MTNNIEQNEIYFKEQDERKKREKAEIIHAFELFLKEINKYLILIMEESESDLSEEEIMKQSFSFIFEPSNQKLTDIKNPFLAYFIGYIRAKIEFDMIFSPFLLDHSKYDFLNGIICNYIDDIYYPSLGPQ
jgi:hypothetical protein